MGVPQKIGNINVAQGDAERECLARLRMGDELAFESIFRAHAAALCDFAFSYVRVREIAEEVVQDLFCWIWEQRFTVDMPYGMRAWLFTAVRNRSLNVLRNRRMEFSIHERVAREARVKVAVVVSPDSELSAAELSEAAARVVQGMPPRCREAYTLIRAQHMGYAEAAQVMGIAPKTVEIHMTRALAILRAALAAWITA
jgi:RNA polymerase sigma-70 factor (ECF subfamily)